MACTWLGIVRYRGVLICTAVKVKGHEGCGKETIVSKSDLVVPGAAKELPLQNVQDFLDLKKKITF